MTPNVTAVSYGPKLTDAELERLRSLWAGHGAAIESESRTGDHRFEVITAGLVVADGTAAGISGLRRAVADSARDGLDTAFVPAGLREAPRKFLIMDVDSTLIQQEVIELLAAYAGKREEVTAVTEAAMRGELDFAQSLHARVAVLAGLPAAVVDSVRAEVKLSEGAADLVAAFKAAGHVVAVVSGGFNQILRPIAEELGLDYWIANELEIVDGALTGKVLGAVIDRAGRAGAGSRRPSGHERYWRESGSRGRPLEALRGSVRS
jgi:phosphoserine phosphatase